MSKAGQPPISVGTGVAHTGGEEEEGLCRDGILAKTSQIDRVEGGVAPPPPTPPDMRATHPAVHQASRIRRHRALMLCGPRASQYRLPRVPQSGGEPDMRQD